MARRTAGVALLAALLGSSAAAQDPAEPPAEGAQGLSVSCRTSLKASLLVSRAPQDPELLPDRDSTTSFWRVRFEPTVGLGQHLTAVVAYEHRLRVFTQTATPGGTILPADTRAPFRIAPLDWSVSEGTGSAWRHEIDRASLTWRAPKATFTLGRQAIGWGRGLVFGAADLFSPFSPLEADREWRRGIDALRVEVPLADRVSAEAVAGFGEIVDESIVAARVRGYAGHADIEVMGGRRARDLFGGATSSAALGDAEVHGEAVVFRARDAIRDAGLPDRTVAKVVAGASYRFGLGPGLLAVAEYHYSGFGVDRPEDILRQLARPAFLQRVQRGDTQILGRHAVAVTVSSELSPELVLGSVWLHSPADGSGVAAPTATISLGDTVALVLNVYVSYGPSPRGGIPHSEYGTNGSSAFAQLRLYL